MKSLLLSVVLVLCLVPSSSSLSPRKVLPGFINLPKSSSISTSTSSYAVVFDGGSTGTRVHVFHFDQSLQLLRIDEEFELYSKVTPGLSSYAKEPKKAAQSLIPLLGKAESVVPSSLRSRTPLRLGATAGLRSLDANTSQLILDAVSDFLKTNSTFKVDSVAIISGKQEGSYLWVTVNYALNNLGQEYTKTAGVVDLGGASVQMAYAIPASDAANAPDGDSYISKMYLKGALYYLYVHSYLLYGQEASRAEILKVSGDSYNPCLLAGFDGTYVYGNVEYKASAPPTGSSFSECRNTVLKVLKVDAACPHKNCTFGGIWKGPGGPGQKHLHLASSFYYRATEAGFADINKPSSKVRIVDFKIAAELACKTTYEEANVTFPLMSQKYLPYACMDLVYQYTLLVDGFGLDPWEVVTVVNKMRYRDSYLDASWALGSAIEVGSSLPKFERFMHVM